MHCLIPTRKQSQSSLTCTQNDLYAKVFVRKMGNNMAPKKTDKVCQWVGLRSIGSLVLCAYLILVLAHRSLYNWNKISSDLIHTDQHSSCTLKALDWDLIEKRKLSKQAAVYTPYALVPGGGERYLLTFIVALQELDYHVHLLVEQNNPVLESAGLDALAQTMGIPLKQALVEIHVMASVSKDLVFDKRYDVFFSLGNSKFPQMKSIGSVNFYMCQFPFDLSRPAQNYEIRNLMSYDYVLLNSEYTLWWYNVYLQKTVDITEKHTKLPEITILYPPVPLAKPNSLLRRVPEARRCINIVLLGRFFQGRQSKVCLILILTFCVTALNL